MNFQIIDVPQRSAEWFVARAGRVSGSRADDMLSKGKGGAESTKKRDLRITLAQEQIAGMALDTGGFVSAEMQRGIDLEPAARRAYEAVEGVFVRETGFLSCDDLLVGASLDGDIDDFRVVVSFKCPKSWTHMSYARLGEKEAPADYIGQIQHELLITGADEYHFVSFDDRFRGKAESLQLVIRKFKREQFDLAGYEKTLRGFLAEVEREREQMLTLGNLSGQLEASLHV